jgi:tetraacyldisaccharide 4'-kinase
MSLRARLEAALNSIWYEQQRPPWILRMLSAIHLRLRKQLKPLRPEQLNLPPMVIVGNLTIGGSGKTPVVIWLVQCAQAAGLKVGVISRGYGGSNANTKHALEVQADSDWRVCGDEALLIKRRTGCRVAVAVDRVQAARLIADGLDWIISDDGLQNGRIPRTVELLVIDGQRRFGNQWLLPAGPLRAPLPVDLPAQYPLRICNGGVVQDGEFVMQLPGERVISSLGGVSRHLSEFGDVYALAGIGNPQRFYRLLEAHIQRVEPISIGDHQLLDADLLAQALAQKPVLTTEKDALKYPAHANLWVVPVSAVIDVALFEKLRSALRG